MSADHPVRRVVVVHGWPATHLHARRRRTVPDPRNRLLHPRPEDDDALRATEQLAQIAVEAEMVPLRNTVVIPQVTEAFDQAGRPVNPLAEITLGITLEDGIHGNRHGFGRSHRVNRALATKKSPGHARCESTGPSVLRHRTSNTADRSTLVSRDFGTLVSSLRQSAV